MREKPFDYSTIGDCRIWEVRFSFYEKRRWINPKPGVWFKRRNPETYSFRLLRFLSDNHIRKDELVPFVKELGSQFATFFEVERNVCSSNDGYAYVMEACIVATRLSDGRRIDKPFARIYSNSVESLDWFHYKVEMFPPRWLFNACIATGRRKELKFN